MNPQGGILDQLLAELQQRQGNSGGMGGAELGIFNRAAPAGNLGSPFYTGPGGLFGVAGLERDVISTRIQPIGLADRLPVIGTIMTNPQFAYFTGFIAPTGSNKNGVCDDPPVAGVGKSCIQTAQFGRYEFSTRELEINRVGQQINRGEFTDLRILNDPLLNRGAITTPNVATSPSLRREVLMRFLEVGVSFQNQLGRQLYEGNPSNNSAGGGYQEFPGLDILIGTNKYDAITGSPCPALNSDIKDFGYGRIDSSTNANSIITVMSYLMRYLRWNADHMNLSPVEWAIVMRPEAFWELSAVWPCAYATYRCNVLGSATNAAVVDAVDMNRMRDEMRNGSYLIVDGIRYPVIQDTYIREDTNTTNNRVTSGCFASDIYVIPLSIRGGMMATYWEHLDYAQGAMVGAEDGRLAGTFYWTDGGRYLWHVKPPNNWCIQHIAKIEPRVILRTPQLAGRVLNVQYCPLQHTRDPIPTDPYFINGGVQTARVGPSLYSDWNHPG